MSRRFVAVLCCTLLSIGTLAAAPAQQANNVVLVTLDGLRWQEVFGGADEALLNEEAGGVEDVERLRADFWRPTAAERRQALMPFLWDVFATEGQLFGNVHRGSEVRVTNGRNFSYPGYQELLAGYPDDRIDSNDKVLNPNPNVLEWVARQPGFEGRVSAFTAWDVFPYILNEPRAGIRVNSGWETVEGAALMPRQQLLNELIATGLPETEGVRTDELTFYAALEYLKNARPRLLYISFDRTDTSAHQRRYDRYLRSAHMADGYLRTLWSVLQSMPEYAGTTALIVTTDHGRGEPPDDWRSHGEDVAGSELMWLAATGPRIEAYGERADAPTVTQAQVAATVAALLGLDYRSDVPRAAPPIDALVR